MKNFQLTFSDGVEIILQIEENKTAELFANDGKFVINSAGELKQEENSNYKITEIKEVGEVNKEKQIVKGESKEIEGVLRACCVYNGRNYCITGACAWMPCGYICG